MMSPIEMQEKACRNRRNGDGNKKNNIIILSLDKNIFRKCDFMVNKSWAWSTFYQENIYKILHIMTA